MLRRRTTPDGERPDVTGRTRAERDADFYRPWGPGYGLAYFALLNPHRSRAFRLLVLVIPIAVAGAVAATLLVAASHVSTTPHHVSPTASPTP